MEIGSPEWWLGRLFKILEERRARYDFLNTYYEGVNGIPVTATKAVRQSYQRLMHLARTNYAELSVEAVRERMAVVGFRTGVADDASGDAEAWRIWQANNLDANFPLVLRSKLSMGDGYMIVGDVDQDIDAPLITVEDPREVVSVQDPRNRRRTIAALKAIFDDVNGVDVAYLYLPGEVHRAIRDNVPATPHVVTWGGGAGWTWNGPIETVPGGRVPVVRFPNRANAYGVSTGEFEPHLPILDRIGFTILTRLEITTMQAYRQRGIKGLESTDEDGNEVNYDDVFAADPGALWMLPEDADIWESGQVDLNPIRQSVRDDVQDFAAVTRTPLFYFIPDAANGSAEGASSSKEGLTFKCRDRIVESSDPAEQVMSLAFLFAGDEQRAKRPAMESIWAPPEHFSLAERYDAASKATGAGVPWRTVMEDVLEFSPQQTDRMEAMRVSDALLTVPTPPPPTTRTVRRGADKKIVSITEGVAG